MNVLGDDPVDSNARASNAHKRSWVESGLQLPLP